MALASGDKLGHYEILSLIGKGGMGEVYKAHDPRVGRDVAIKVAAAQFSERFDREVRAVAALNHPNICTLYDVGPNYLVMEFVEGVSPKGPLPLEEALRIAHQITDALEAAHEKGITHRDLKPGNILIKPDGLVKVLDFGLAKQINESQESDATLTLGATQPGAVLGTPAYMAPEQARGKKADKRADIWAFGVVLHELLTGKRMFQGEDLTETLAAVVMKEPDLNVVPANLRRLLKKCLEKDPKKRLRDIGDVWDYVESGTEVPLQARARTTWLPWAVAAAAVLVAWAPWRVEPPAPNLGRFEIPAPEKVNFSNALLLSPDGRQLAFAGNSSDGNQIWVRSLDTLKARPVAPWSQNPGPFWSPDSRFIVFQQDGKLKKVDITGGPPIPLTDAPQAFGGGAWSPNGVLVFGDRAGPLKQVSSAGGIAAVLTKLDEKRQETSHGFPSFLPDGKHFVYIRRSSSPENTGIYIGSLDSTPEHQDSKLLIATENAAVYTPVADPREATRGLGFLLFLRAETLMAQPFDAAALALKGEPVPVADGVGSTAYGYGRFTAAQNGGLAYLAGGTGGATTRLTWFDRQGKNLGTIGQPGPYNSLALSPDGSRVAVDKRDATASDLWLIESAIGGKSDRFTFDPALDFSPVWSPDGSQIIYASGSANALNLFKKPSNLAGDAVEVFKSPESKFPSDWSRDGKTLVFTAAGNSAATVDVWFLPLESTGKQTELKAEPFIKTEQQEQRGKLSPDGRWMAYTSNANGRSEVYVRPFPPSAERSGQVMVSNGGGAYPLWRRDGKELYYRGPQGVMAVDVTLGAVFKSGQAKLLFPQPPAGAINGPMYNWDVTPDGSRFLFNVAGGETASQQPITLVLNWTAGLK